MLKLRKVPSQASREKQHQALGLRLKGLSYAEIGKIMGISRQRVQQIIRPPAQVYDFIKRKTDGRCEDCGIPIKSGHIHHREALPADQFNAIENLMYLCISCHKQRHIGDLDGRRVLAGRKKRNTEATA